MVCISLMDKLPSIRVRILVARVQLKYILMVSLKYISSDICCNYGQFCSSSQRHMYKEMKSVLAYWHSPGPFFRVYPRTFWTERMTRLLWPRQIVYYVFDAVAYWGHNSLQKMQTYYCRLSVRKKINRPSALHTGVFVIYTINKSIEYV